MSIGTIKQAEQMLKAYAEDLHSNGYQLPECPLASQQVGKSASVQVELTRYQVPRHGELQNRARLFAQAPTQAPTQTQTIKESDQITEEDIQDEIEDTMEDFYSFNRRTYESATKRLVSIGPKAVPPLIQAMNHLRPEVRERAILALGEIKPPAVTAIPYLIRALMEGAGNIPTAAAATLINMGEVSVIPLIEKLKELSAPVDPRLGSEKHFWMMHKHFVVEENIQFVLSQIGSSAVPHLLDLLKDSNPRNRRNAALILKEMGLAATPAIGELGRMAKGDANADCQRVAKEAIEQLRGEIH